MCGLSCVDRINWKPREGGGSVFPFPRSIEHCKVVDMAEYISGVYVCRT